MSELKAFRIIQGDTGGYGAPSYKCDTDGNRIEEWSDVCEVYDRFEADKEIAEKDAEIERLRGESCKLTDGCLRLKQCRKEKANIADKLCHSNYKRCLAMAKWCNRMFSITFGKERYWQKWNRKWLELAEKLKEAK